MPSINGVDGKDGISFSSPEWTAEIFCSRISSSALSLCSARQALSVSASSLRLSFGSAVPADFRAVGQALICRVAHRIMLAAQTDGEAKVFRRVLYGVVADANRES